MTSPTTLIADDKRLTATPLTRALKAKGYEVLNALAGAGIIREGAPRVSSTY
jgi:hypothetical protein